MSDATATPSEGHTPLPWQIGSPDDTLILGPNREEIAYMHGDYDFGDAYMAMEANCALIVTAVNERPKLLARIKRLDEALRKARVSIATWSPDPTEPLEEIDAALKTEA